MRPWWDARTLREQVLIGCGIAIILAFFAYQAVYRPLLAFRIDASQSNQDAVAYLADVQAAAQSIRNARATSSTHLPLGDGGLRAAGTSAAIDVGLTISRLQPLEQGGVEFWIDSAPAPLVYRWIASLHQKHGVTVSKADIRQLDGSENVRAQIALAGEPSP
jgi:type II secretory pathway component PulM